MKLEKSGFEISRLELELSVAFVRQSQQAGVCPVWCSLPKGSAIENINSMRH